jgi:hypothetical protein
MTPTCPRSCTRLDRWRCCSLFTETPFRRELGERAGAFLRREVTVCGAVVVVEQRGLFVGRTS